MGSLVSRIAEMQDRKLYQELNWLGTFDEYLEIVRPETVTQTFAFDALPPGVHSVDTVVLEDHGDKTVYRATSILPDIAARDGMMASGMDSGVREGFARLDAMLEEFKATV